MIVDFYHNFSDRYQLRKQISGITSAECRLIDECNVESPILRVKYNSRLVSCNYAYIPDFGNYYYVDSPQLMPGGQMQLFMHNDYLMSYADEIEQLQVNARYAQGTNRTYVPDGRVAMQNAIDIRTINFPFAIGSQNFSTNSYMLTVIGGASSPVIPAGGDNNG